MSAPINDGGSAFPNPRFTNEFGMTSRDYFAAKAMQGYLASSVAQRVNSPIEYAKAAYAMADAMLKARSA